MNGQPARLLSTAALMLGLMTQGCGPKEAEPMPTAVSPDFTPLAAEVCFDWLSQVRETQNRFNTERSWTQALETCTKNLAQTANTEGWPVGPGHLVHVDENATREGEVAIAIAGQVGLWDEDAVDLAGRIVKATPDQ